METCLKIRQRNNGTYIDNHLTCKQRTRAELSEKKFYFMCVSNTGRLNICILFLSRQRRTLTLMKYFGQICAVVL